MTCVSDEISTSICSPAAGAAAEAGATAAGKKKRKQRQLARPVICVCNDLYAPVMRPLRARAAIFQFKQPSVCWRAATLFSSLDCPARFGFWQWWQARAHVWTPANLLTKYLEKLHVATERLLGAAQADRLISRMKLICGAEKLGADRQVRCQGVVMLLPDTGPSAELDCLTVGSSLSFHGSHPMSCQISMCKCWRRRRWFTGQCAVVLRDVAVPDAC